MTPVSLVDELCEFLQHLLKDYVLDSPEGEEKALNVLPGYPILWDGFDSLSDAFVMVSAASGKDSTSKALVQIKIWIKTNSQEQENLWRDTLNILEHIRQGLFKKRVIAKKFRLEHPMKWEVLPEYDYPGCFAVITTNWTVASPTEEATYGQDQKEQYSWNGAGDILWP